MHYRWEKRVKKSTLVPNLFQEKNYFRNGNFIQFLDQKILLWDKDFEKPTTALYFDYIVVGA